MAAAADAQPEVAGDIIESNGESKRHRIATFSDFRLMSSEQDGKKPATFLYGKSQASLVIGKKAGPS